MTALRCKPGDLALIIRSPFPENLMRQVNVIELAPNLCSETGSPCWWVQPQSPITVQAFNSLGLPVGIPFPSNQKSLAADSELMPIRPDAHDETQTSTQQPRSETQPAVQQTKSPHTAPETAAETQTSA